MDRQRLQFYKEWDCKGKQNKQQVPSSVVMISDKLISLEQPLTHTSQQGVCQKVCCRDYELTREELREFYDLKRDANVLYSGTPQEIEKIRGLYKLYFKEEIPKDFTTRKWLQLGFQGDRPERDLRGGGILSLDLIRYFVEKERDTVESMGKEESDFFFAVTAINVAFFMKKYFHLADYLQPQIDQHQYCSRRSLKNFVRLIEAQKNGYFQLHRTFLRYFYHGIWKKGAKKTLLNFNESFDQLTQRIREAFNQGDRLEMGQVTSNFVWR